MRCIDPTLPRALTPACGHSSEPPPAGAMQKFKMPCCGLDRRNVHDREHSADRELRS